MSEIPFESEYILHIFTQKHLKELFDLEFVASEIQLNKLRLDNLAFDNKTNAFVIIEYKNEFDANVLSQAQEYHNLVLDNREFFLKRLENHENVNFENTRIMIIGPEFSESQIKKANSNFELWKITLFDDGNFTYENMKTSEIESLNIDLKELELTEEMLLENKPPEICEIYLNLKDKLISNFDDLKSRILIDAVSFRLNNRLICIVNVKNTIKIHYFTDNLEDPQNKLRDISQITTGGLANYELTLTSEKDIDYAIDLFKNVCNQKME